MALDNHDEHDMETHYGKGMLKIVDGQLTIVFECRTCGRFQIGPMPAEHATSIGAQLMRWGQSVGLPEGELEKIEELEGDDPELISKGERRFENMTLRGPEPGEGSAWD